MLERAPLITEMIFDRPICLGCLATNGGTSIERVRANLEPIATSVIVHQTPEERCRVCGVIGPVISIVKSINVALVRNLLAGGAQMCADCIARKTRISLVKIPSAIESARKTSYIVQTQDVPCAVCRSSRTVYRLHEPGASDVRLVMVALWNERLCMTCLVARTGIPTARIEAIRTELGRVLTVTTSAANCDGCSAPTRMLTLV